MGAARPHNGVRDEIVKEYEVVSLRWTSFYSFLANFDRCAEFNDQSNWLACVEISC
jgi:hypothetical protein